MKILIVDDEPLARQRLVGLIGELGFSAELYEAENGLVALEFVKTNTPDIVLLDIRMPVMDGLETAQHICNWELSPAVIFTTAYQEHALKAFDINAIDYLLKPVKKERLQQAIERATTLQRGRIEKIRQKESNVARAFLSARFHGNLKLVPVNEVRYLRAEQKYVAAGWPEGELLLDESLVSLEKEFPDQFFRIHRNALIAIPFVDTLVTADDGSCTIKMRGVGNELPVSRRNLAELRKLLKKS